MVKDLKKEEMEQEEPVVAINKEEKLEAFIEETLLP